LGAYVTMRPAPKLGDEVAVGFSLPDGLSLDLKGVVVWRNSEEREKVDPLAPGCGIRFVDVPDTVEKRLWAFVDGYSSTAG
jgi:hypothetical protein